MRLPDLYDIQDRRIVEQPNMEAPHLIQHSSLAKADRYEHAIRAMPKDAQMRYARLLYTVETLAIILESARTGKPVLQWGE